MNRTPFFYLEVAVFLVFISLGYWTGTNLKPESTVSAGVSQLKPTSSPIPSLPDGERILLVAGVDELDSAQPQLESLWLLTYYLDEQPVQMLPIYPSGANSLQPFESQLLDAFSLIRKDGVTQLSPGFLKQFAENNFWLSGYLLVDDRATAAIIDMLGGMATDHGLRTGAQIVRALPSSAEQPHAAHGQQAILLGQACLTFSRLSSPPHWDPVLELIPEHIITDIHPLRLLGEIELLAAHLSQLRCEFPSIPAVP
jgi:hypothetical protein